MTDITRDIIVIGASAGGVDALMALAPRLPARESLSASDATSLLLQPLSETEPADGS